MNGLNATRLIFPDEARASPYSTSIDEDQLFKQYKPAVKDLIPLPKPVIYLLMAALIVVGVAYAIVGHLIRDLAIDIAECLLGPPGDEDKAMDNERSKHPRHPPPNMSLSHTNAFHVWDQDDMMIPLPGDDSPEGSPLLLAAIPYIPSFFPGHPHPHGHVFHSPLNHSPLQHYSNPSSPGILTEITISRDG